MGKYAQVFLDVSPGCAGKKDVDIVPTRDEVDQSRRLVEEIRHPRNDDEAAVKDRPQEPQILPFSKSPKA